MEKRHITEIKKLQLRKYREEYGLFIVEGTKSVADLLASELKTVQLAATPEWLAAHGNIVPESVETLEAGTKDLERVSGLKSPQEVLAVAETPRFDIGTLSPDSPVLALDCISDPGNMGTIMRTADWFGITDIVCSSDTVEFANPKVIQASMGSFCRVRVFHTDLCAFLKSQKDRNIYGTFLDGTPVEQVPFRNNDIIIIGNEGNGISDEVSALATGRVNIRTCARGDNRAESLNAAISTGIILYQFRQKTCMP